MRSGLRLGREPIQIERGRFQDGHFPALSYALSKVERRETWTAADVETFPTRLDADPVEKPVGDALPDPVLKPQPFEFLRVDAEKII